MTVPSAEKAPSPPEDSYDVVVVGGGAAGLSAALFTQRYGLETLVLDRGSSAIRRCYDVENYLGLLGIDPETFLELGRAHVRYEGAAVVDGLVVDVTMADSSSAHDTTPTDLTPRFVVETQAGDCVEAHYVVAASVYNADYLAGLADGRFHDADDHPVECDEASGRTKVDGLYVAGWLSGGPHQVLISAGHGARVGKSLIYDHRLAEEEFWEAVATYWDWCVEDGTYGDEEWHRLVDEWFDERTPDDVDSARVERVRARLKAERLDFQQTAEERAQRQADARTLLREHLLAED